MAFVTQYLIPRLIQYFLVIFLGVTAVFVIPRLAPTDPVLRTITSLRAQGSSLDPTAVERMIEDLREHYGLQGSMLQQYGALWKKLFTADFLLLSVPYTSNQTDWRITPMDSRPPAVHDPLCLDYCKSDRRMGWPLLSQTLVEDS